MENPQWWSQPVPTAAVPAGTDDIVLVTLDRHLADLHPRDGLLVVTTEWALWRRASLRGFHALHLDGLLTDWCPRDCTVSAYYSAFLHWYMADGKDMTLYRGISVGQAIYRELGYAVLAHERLFDALIALMARTSAKRVRLRDLRGDYFLVDDDMKRWMVANAAGSDVEIIDELDPAPPGHPEIVDLDTYGRTTETRPWRDWLRNVVCRSIDAVFRLSHPSGRRVLLMLNPAMERGLTNGPPAAEFSATLIAQRSPKSLAALRHFFKNRVTLAALPATRRRGKVAKKIHRQLKDHWKSSPPATTRDFFLRSVLDKRLLPLGRIEDCIAEIDGFSELLKRRRMDSVVIADSGNRTSGLLAEIAHNAGVTVYELLNGMFLFPMRHPRRHQLDHVSCQMTWGLQQEIWLQGHLRHIRVGYPALDLLPAVRTGLCAPPSGGKALILPITPSGDNITALRCHSVGLTVALVAMLQRLGHDDIRVKVHPGHENAHHLQAVLAEAGLNCHIYKEGSVLDHLPWADFVIGSPETGSFIETLAAGKPYYPLLPPPAIIDPAFLGNYPLFQSLEDLEDALARRNPLNVSELLDHLCDRSNTPVSADRFWRALATDRAGATEW